MSDAPLKATLKAGKDYDAPWLTVDGTTPDELTQRLNGIVAAGTLEAVVSAASALKAVQVATTQLGAQPVQQQQPQQQGGWQNSPPQQQPAWSQPAPQQQQQAPQGQRPGHPEGKSCTLCGKVLEYGTTRSNKPQWKCPDYRYNNGNPNDHTLEWVN